MNGQFRKTSRNINNLGWYWKRGGERFLKMENSIPFFLHLPFYLNSVSQNSGLGGEGDVETQGMFHNDSQSLHILSWPPLCVTPYYQTITFTLHHHNSFSWQLFFFIIRAPLLWLNLSNNILLKRIIFLCSIKQFIKDNKPITTYIW